VKAYLWLLPAILVWLSYLAPLAPWLLWVHPHWWSLPLALVLSPAGLPIALGFPLVALFAGLERYHVDASCQYPGRSVLTWIDSPVRQWWGNEENGINGATGPLPAGWPRVAWPLWRQIWVWSAWRNSVGNARWLPYYGCTVDPKRVHVYMFTPGLHETKVGQYLARFGWRFELRLCYNPTQLEWQKRRFLWVGWRLAQQTTLTPGVGFAFQLWAAL